MLPRHTWMWETHGELSPIMALGRGGWNLEGGGIPWSLVVKAHKKAGCGTEPYKTKSENISTSNTPENKHLPLSTGEGPLN